MIDVFGETIADVAKRAGQLELVLPTVPHLADLVRDTVANWAIVPRIVVDQKDKWTAFRNARAALAASGTVTLELALAGVPTVGAYRVTAIEAFVARRFGIPAKLQSFILANLVLGENIIPELFQEECTPDRLADVLLPLLSDTPQRRNQIEAFARLDAIMGIGGEAPSARAADIVLDYARQGRR